MLQALDQLALGHGSLIDQGGGWQGRVFPSAQTNGNSVSSSRSTVGLLGREVYNLHSSSCGTAKDRVIGVAFSLKCNYAEPSGVKTISAPIFARWSLFIKVPSNLEGTETHGLLGSLLISTIGNCRMVNGSGLW